jgi:hypothetical protein
MQTEHERPRRSRAGAHPPSTRARARTELKRAHADSPSINGEVRQSQYDASAAIAFVLAPA